MARRGARRSPWLPLLVAGLVAAGCGARTAALDILPAEGPDASNDAPSATESGTDAGVDSPEEVGTEADLDTSPETLDVAEEPAPDGQACTSSAQCNDGIPCVTGTCDLAIGQCVYMPNSTLCPTGFVCEIPLGCTAGGYAVSDSTLYSFEVPSGALASIGPTGASMYDIALHPNGTLYGVDSVGGLYTIDVTTGNATLLVSLSGDSDANALEATPDGTLYGATEEGELFTIDPQTGVTTDVLTYPDDLTSSGDLAAIGSLLYASASGTGSSDELLVIDPASGSASVVGSIGFQCVYGLASYAKSLFGFTCGGDIVSIDTTTGAGTVVATGGPEYYGASAR
jgi:hypothetical protein